MSKSLAIIGAGVSGLTCAVVFAEYGYRVSIFAEETGQRTTSAAAAALWYPYDAEPMDKVIDWALKTYKVLVDLSGDSSSGVSMVELRTFSRAGEIQVPDWAVPLGARHLAARSGTERSVTMTPTVFKSGFALRVPLMDTTIYLEYLVRRFSKAGGTIQAGVHFEKLEDVPPRFVLVINCAGVGARSLVHDTHLEPHRGQVAIVPNIDNLSCAIVCDDAPLMYAIPRTQDCVFGGTNELSDNRDVDPTATSRIVTECSGVLNIARPRVLAERVGLRPFRKTGVRIERGKLRDGRSVIHNYGHGGSGFTLSWGCAREVLALAV